ncbi:MAG: anti-sigma factor [Bacteroidota bacterium]
MSEDALKHTIRKLPLHRPSEQLWNRIEGDLALGQAFAQLPTYRPSDAVWEDIESQLPARRVWMRTRRWMSIAAGVAAILFATLWWQAQQNEAVVSLGSTVETHQSSLLAADWNEDEDAFAVVAQVCEQYPFLCERQNFQSLQTELNELEDAKNMVLVNMQKYGRQARLVHQVKAIEQERSAVLKEIIEMI